MSATAVILLAALSIWDYPARQLQHEQFQRAFLVAVKNGDRPSMVVAAENGVKLLPDDSVWRYNHACALAQTGKNDDALDELEKAIDLGMRNPDAIAADKDFKPLAEEMRFKVLVEYARELSERPVIDGPNVHVPQFVTAGGSVALGEQNFSWDFDHGLLIADMKLEPGVEGGNTGDLYMNRDKGHSILNPTAFPGLTVVRLDAEGSAHGLDVDLPNTLFPYPTFGNVSRALLEPKYWRSLPRMAMTREAWRMKSFQKLYLSNQLWFMPAHEDCPPKGRHGDVFSSICPYFWVSAGSSFTDQPFLRAALEASRSMQKETKAAAVAKGLLAPTIMTLMRKSLRSVTNEVEYLTAAAHPTAFAAGSLDVARLKKAAAELSVEGIPPLVPVSLIGTPVKDRPQWPEPTYVTPFATAVVLRSEDTVRRFRIVANGARDYEFRILRGGNAAKLVRSPQKQIADLEIDRSRMSVSNRVDIGVFGRTLTSGWGAPSYISFAVVDPSAPYSDPVLTPPVGPLATPPEQVQKKDAGVR